jgi:hypothetical protein
MPATGAAPLPPPMKQFIIRLQDGNYVMNVCLTSNYLDYDRARDPAQASPLNDFDSQLVLKRLRYMGEKKAEREQVADET